jgi:hypothetical protein
MNTRRAPGRVLGDHAEDQFTQFPADTLPSRPSSMPREPTPIQLEPCPVPANNSLWLDEDQRSFPPRPQAAQHHPKQSVRSGKSRLRMRPLQNPELLPQRQILQSQIAASEDIKRRERAGALAGGAWDQFYMRSSPDREFGLYT